MLYRRAPHGGEACFIGHGLMENRSGPIADAWPTLVSGHAERLAAGDDRAVRGSSVRDHARRRQGLRHRRFRRRGALDERRQHVNAGALLRSSMEHYPTPKLRPSQRIRKRIEEGFGRIKTIAGLRKTRFIGRAKITLAFTRHGRRYLVRRRS